MGRGTLGFCIACYGIITVKTYENCEAVQETHPITKKKYWIHGKDFCRDELQWENFIIKLDREIEEMELEQAQKKSAWPKME